MEECELPEKEKAKLGLRFSGEEEDWNQLYLNLSQTLNSGLNISLSLSKDQSLATTLLDISKIRAWPQ